MFDRLDPVSSAIAKRKDSFDLIIRLVALRRRFPCPLVFYITFTISFFTLLILRILFLEFQLFHIPLNILIFLFVSSFISSSTKKTMHFYLLFCSRKVNRTWKFVFLFTAVYRFQFRLISCKI